MGRKRLVKVSAEQVSRVLACIESATDAELAAGRLWYRSFGAACVRESVRHGAWCKDPVAVFAALSPRSPIKANWQCFCSIMETRSTSSKKYAVLPLQLQKVQSYLNGSATVADMTSGDKVSRFARNLSGDLSCVTIDTHAIACALGSGQSCKGISHGDYLDLEAVYRTVASMVGMAPAEAQAVAWVAHRRALGVKDTGGIALVA